MRQSCEAAMGCIPSAPLQLRHLDPQPAVGPSASPLTAPHGGGVAVIMDELVPRLGGTEATIRLRAAGFTGPILGISGNADVETSRAPAMLSAGANEVMRKPVGLLELVEALQRQVQPDPVRHSRDTSSGSGSSSEGLEPTVLRL